MNVLSKVVVDVRELLVSVCVAGLRILRLDHVARISSNAVKTILPPWSLWSSRQGLEKTEILAIEDESTSGEQEGGQSPREEPSTTSGRTMSPCTIDENGVPTYEALPYHDVVKPKIVDELKFPGIDVDVCPEDEEASMETVTPGHVESMRGASTFNGEAPQHETIEAVEDSQAPKRITIFEDDENEYIGEKRKEMEVTQSSEALLPHRKGSKSVRGHDESESLEVDAIDDTTDDYVPREESNRLAAAVVDDGSVKEAPVGTQDEESSTLTKRLAAPKPDEQPLSLEESSGLAIALDNGVVHHEQMQEKVPLTDVKGVKASEKTIEADGKMQKRHEDTKDAVWCSRGVEKTKESSSKSQQGVVEWEESSGLEAPTDKRTRDYATLVAAQVGVVLNEISGLGTADEHPEAPTKELSIESLALPKQEGGREQRSSVAPIAAKGEGTASRAQVDSVADKSHARDENDAPVKEENVWTAVDDVGIRISDAVDGRSQRRNDAIALEESSGLAVAYESPKSSYYAQSMTPTKAKTDVHPAVDVSAQKRAEPPQQTTHTPKEFAMKESSGLAVAMDTPSDKDRQDKVNRKPHEPEPEPVGSPTRLEQTNLPSWMEEPSYALVSSATQPLVRNGDREKELHPPAVHDASIKSLPTSWITASVGTGDSGNDKHTTVAEDKQSSDQQHHCEDDAVAMVEESSGLAIAYESSPLAKTLMTPTNDMIPPLATHDALERERGEPQERTVSQETPLKSPRVAMKESSGVAEAATSVSPDKVSMASKSVAETINSPTSAVDEPSWLEEPSYMADSAATTGSGVDTNASRVEKTPDVPSGAFSSSSASAFTKALRGPSTSVSPTPLSAFSHLLKPVQRGQDHEVEDRRMRYGSNDTEDTESDRHLEEVESNDDDVEEAPEDTLEQSLLVEISSSDESWSGDDEAFTSVPPALQKRVISAVYYTV